MTDADLEAIRPAHVSMGAMWFWYATRTGMVLALAGIPVGIVATIIFHPAVLLVAASFLALALCLLLWLVSIVFFFARFSLRTLMLIVLVTAGLVSLCVSVPPEFLLGPLIGCFFWIVALYMVVANRDPQRNAGLVVPKSEPDTLVERADDREPDE
ncbi:MAG: hypothetical protein L6R28_11480 [Planctomycetes bacterium]|nr:hypothetical protein [Planctomycetota bacterium]